MGSRQKAAPASLTAPTLPPTNEFQPLKIPDAELPDEEQSLVPSGNNSPFPLPHSSGIHRSANTSVSSWRLFSP